MAAKTALISMLSGDAFDMALHEPAGSRHAVVHPIRSFRIKAGCR
jgi:hypothetical protein